MEKCMVWLAQESARKWSVYKSWPEVIALERNESFRGSDVVRSVTCGDVCVVGEVCIVDEVGESFELG